MKRDTISTQHNTAKIIFLKLNINTKYLLPIQPHKMKNSNCFAKSQNRFIFIDNRKVGMNCISNYIAPIMSIVLNNKYATV